ncbi:uncharacterized protein YegJ (DUF2314 family) [Hymenobacter luteus]|uniref:Uncharacterized protein YegJ (DUF2314 family) n=2 Tax=Hymenobacter TaxID=89966 RepID=A0A7W9T307_9BACT|nr:MULTISPECIES: DUF2314 domain-containing protein [Hymenobacter]MBB4602755.1 uncharacterized protein YegJ (DUF2314 family) [Hymenobacter latericoloratus]MBB6060646.1 uncharacterized protein YegJ (DUF2314 family) [Hymenobacter luteus]
MRISIPIASGILLALVSCTISTDKVERPGEPAIYNVTAEDTEMNHAIRQGKATLPQFLATISKADSTISNPAVKVHYDDGERKEFLWIGDPILEEGQWYGTVDNTPEYTKQVVAGQKVRIDTAIVVDWNYTQNNHLVGGYTVKLLRNRMTPEERAEFDQSTDLIFDR